MTQPGYDPLDTAGQERNLAQDAEEVRRQRDKELNDLRWVMSTKQGRRFMHRRLSEAGVWRLSFSYGLPAADVAFNEGSRNAGLTLLNEIIEACPERYTEMLTEHKEAKERHDNRNADRRNRNA